MPAYTHPSRTAKAGSSETNVPRICSMISVTRSTESSERLRQAKCKSQTGDSRDKRPDYRSCRLLSMRLAPQSFNRSQGRLLIRLPLHMADRQEGPGCIFQCAGERTPGCQTVLDWTVHHWLGRLSLLDQGCRTVAGRAGEKFCTLWMVEGMSATCIGLTSHDN